MRAQGLQPPHPPLLVESRTVPWKVVRCWGPAGSGEAAGEARVLGCS